MKVLSKVLLIILLAAIFGLAGCNKSKLPEVKSSAIPLPTIKPSSTDKSVIVLFPQKANVRLVEGVSKIGWISINFSEKQVELSFNSDSEMIDIARIKKIDFDLNRAIFSDGDMVIQGDESSDLIQETWTEIPISDVEWKEDKTGEVTLKLNNSALSQDKQEGINFIVRDGIYVVEEILFDQSSSKMTLKVLCCSV